jgi:hypothetical protein
MIVNFQESWCCTWKAMGTPHFHPIHLQNHMPVAVGSQVHILLVGVRQQALLARAFTPTRIQRQDQLTAGELAHPDLRRPPTECLRDSFAREDSSAPCCINFLPPRRSRFPRNAFFSFFLVFFFLAIAANYSACCSTSTRIPNSWVRPPGLPAIGNAKALADRDSCVLEVGQARN